MQGVFVHRGRENFILCFERAKGTIPTVKKVSQRPCLNSRKERMIGMMENTNKQEYDRLSVSYQKKPCYDIVFEHSFDNLPKELQALFGESLLQKRSLCVITDDNVNGLFGAEIKGLLQGICKEVSCYVFPAGEKHKTLETVSNIYRFLIEKKLTRKDMLIALGGGVVGDITGFVAATYLRGIDFIQIPTTLLSQVDSSIGGKTGVDFEQYKNMVGAFHMPRLVYTNVSVLKELDERQFASGFAEVMKHGLIKDRKYYGWLLENMYEIDDREPDVLREMVYKSCVIKKNVVEKDPLEKGERALLNFGHTIGHGIEKASNFTLLHGECVALGCIAAANISYKKGLIAEDEYLEIRDMFVPFHLPIALRNIAFSAGEVVENTKSDKKNASGTLRFILLEKLGKAIIDETVTERELLLAVEDLIIHEQA